MAPCYTNDVILLRKQIKMPDGLSEETVAIDGLKLVRLRRSQNGEGHSLWIGKHCAEYGYGTEESALRKANEIEAQVMRVFIQVVIPDLVKKFTQDAIDILNG